MHKITLPAITLLLLSGCVTSKYDKVAEQYVDQPHNRLELFMALLKPEGRNHIMVIQEEPEKVECVPYKPVPRASNKYRYICFTTDKNNIVTKYENVGIMTFDPSLAKN